MALSHLVVQYESNFCTVALQFMEEEKNYPLPSPAAPGRWFELLCIGNVWSESAWELLFKEFTQHNEILAGGDLSNSIVATKVSGTVGSSNVCLAL